jgi:hypothetical protein
METEGYGYIRRAAGVDVERQCFDLRILLESKGFGLQVPVIVDGDGKEFVRLLRLVESPDTAGPVFVPHLRHLTGGRVDVVRLFVPVCSVQPWRMLERRELAAVVSA